jgi:hypothetical protein
MKAATNQKANIKGLVDDVFLLIGIVIAIAGLRNLAGLILALLSQ